MKDSDKRPLNPQEYWGMVDMISWGRNFLRNAKFHGRRERRVEVPEYIYWDIYHALQALDCLPDDATENA